MLTSYGNTIFSYKFSIRKVPTFTLPDIFIIAHTHLQERKTRFNACPYTHNTPIKVWGLGHSLLKRYKHRKVQKIPHKVTLGGTR